jgi:hypothetical protein
MKKITALLLIAALAFSCTTSTQKGKKEEQPGLSVIENQKAFLRNLATLCGNSFGGKEVFTKEGRTSWAEKKFVMHVTICDDEKVYIPFHLDNDHSRTWMFLMEEKGLRFRHDHRHEDGTPEKQTLYGGYADSTGTAFVQSFPWDDYTKELLADGKERKWKVFLSEELKTFTYELYYAGEMVFAAEFDLTKPIEKQKD